MEKSKVEKDVSAVEKLNELEKKITSIIDLLKIEKEKSFKLAKEKEELESRLESIENSLLKENQNLEELNQEKALTKMVVDELITNIDKLTDTKQEER